LGGAAGSARGAGAAGFQGGVAAGPSSPDFSDSMKEFFGEVNRLQLHAGEMVQAFARGEVRDLHQVALAQQEAGIALRLVTEMRDRLISAYQEVMRTQV